jgi:hypothetical protein
MIICLSGGVRGGGVCEASLAPQEPKNTQAREILGNALLPLLRSFRRLTGGRASLARLALVYARVFLGENPSERACKGGLCNCFDCIASEREGRLSRSQEQALSRETRALIYWLRHFDRRSLWGSLAGAREAMREVILSEELFGAWILFELECLAPPGLSEEGHYERLRLCRDLLKSEAFLGSQESGGLN